MSTSAYYAMMHEACARAFDIAFAAGAGPFYEMCTPCKRVALQMVDFWLAELRREAMNE